MKRNLVLAIAAFVSIGLAMPQNAHALRKTYKLLYWEATTGGSLSGETSMSHRKA
ncbi:MAG: hypothetical protein PHU25_06890 [Deltaproteobacteria bacterium]|nr:hypothetical protein [Deltaproteobacteria bacterium]